MREEEDMPPRHALVVKSYGCAVFALATMYTILDSEGKKADGVHGIALPSTGTSRRPLNIAWGAWPAWPAWLA